MLTCVILCDPVILYNPPLAVVQNWYLGDDRSMLIPNTLFRMGGAAMILTNRLTERHRAKYELKHVVRVHLGADDVAYE